MKERNFLYLAGLLTAFCLLTPQEASAWEPICELPNPQGCSSTREAIIYPGNMGPESYCPQVSGYYCVKKSVSVPPAPAWLHCMTESAYTSICNVWPRGDVQYDWAASGGISIPSINNGHTTTVSCNNSHGSGMVSVEITTTQGLTETVFAGIQCGSIEP